MSSPKALITQQLPTTDLSSADRVNCFCIYYWCYSVETSWHPRWLLMWPMKIVAKPISSSYILTVWRHGPHCEDWQVDSLYKQLTRKNRTSYRHTIASAIKNYFFEFGSTTINYLPVQACIIPKLALCTGIFTVKMYWPVLAVWPKQFAKCLHGLVIKCLAHIFNYYRRSCESLYVTYKNIQLAQKITLLKL